MCFWEEIEDPKERGSFSHVNTETTFLFTNYKNVVSSDPEGNYLTNVDRDLGHNMINWASGLAKECALTAEE